MGSYMEILKTYIADNPLQIECSNTHILLEILYCCFCQRKKTDAQSIRDYFRNLDGILSPQPVSEQDDIFNLICSLCTEYARNGFSDGIIAGFHLFNELNHTE